VGNEPEANRAVAQLRPHYRRTGRASFALKAQSDRTWKISSENDGFKGFNQEGVNAIITATDPRKNIGA